ncbi:MAG: hypothetical protein KKA62_05395 [Nanoarchaeota archaeon]|nr:hypothetical protein [Nanoarchaeota archaeon]MBU1644572.1 hypothetical protein [Nanoarchaeota archaeon]MBU1977357.1 hypothetical protein [Nanoarchaeota archaeon]
MNKKGFFYTLGLMFFALALLTLSVLFVNHSVTLESRQSELNFAQKIYDQDTSTQKALSDTFLRKSNLILALSNDTFTVQETLPVDFSELDSSLSTLESALENSFPIDVGLSLFLSSHDLILQNSNVSYLHNSPTTISIPANSAVSNYNLTLIFSSAVTSCDINAPSGQIGFYFDAQPSNVSCSLAQGVSEAEIGLIVNGQEININLDSSKALTFESDAGVTSTITLMLNESIGRVELPITIAFNDSGLNFNKVSKVRVFLSS